MPAGIQAEADQKSEAQMRREQANVQLDAEGESQRDNEGAPSLSGTTAIEGEEGLRESEETARGGVTTEERED